jgi:hypothetical protein
MKRVGIDLPEIPKLIVPSDAGQLIVPPGAGKILEAARTTPGLLQPVDGDLAAAIRKAAEDSPVASDLIRAIQENSK